MQTWSVREAGRGPLEGIVSEKTLASHIANGILVPSKRVEGAASKGTGSKLSFSDLVEAAIKYTQFRQGLKIDHVMIRGKQFPTARLWIGGESGEWGTRQPQKFLECHDYKVIVAMTMKRALISPITDDVIVSGVGLPWSGHNIADVRYIATSDGPHVKEALGSIRVTSPVESHLFINANHWKDVIEDRLSR